MQQNIKGSMNELWKYIKKKRNSEMKCIPGANWEQGASNRVLRVWNILSSAGKGMRQQGRLA